MADASRHAPSRGVPDALRHVHLGGVVVRILDRQVLEEVEEGCGDGGRGHYLPAKLCGEPFEAGGELLVTGADGDRPALRPRPVHSPAAAIGVQGPEQGDEGAVLEGHRELFAGLRLGGVRLVHDPVTQGRQDAACGGGVPEEQGVVRDDDVRGPRAPPHAVEVAEVRVEPAPATRAVLHGARYLLAQGPPVDVHRVEVPPR
jgi:hypothetical protein